MQSFSNQASALLAYLYGGGAIRGRQIVAPNLPLAFLYEQQCYGGQFNVLNPLHARCAFFGHISRYNLSLSNSDRESARAMLEQLSKVPTVEGAAASNILSWFEGKKTIKRISCDLNGVLDFAPSGAAIEPNTAYCHVARGKSQR